MSEIAVEYKRGQECANTHWPLTHSLDYGKEQAVEQHTCAINDCDRPRYSRGWCEPHYQRARYNDGDPLRYCRGCNATLPLNLGNKPFCSDDCKPRCEIPGCNNVHYSHGWCLGHVRRAEKNNGDPNLYCRGCDSPMPIRRGKNIYCNDACRPRCVVDGCDRAMRSSDGRCGPCYQRAIRNGGNDLSSVKCADCGEGIDLTATTGSGRRKSSRTTLCGECRTVHGREWRVAIPRIIKRDGLDCGVCGNEIDQTIAWPDPHSLSVDHIMPRSLGGSHDLENLRLAHLSCNVKRSNRIDELQAA